MRLVSLFDDVATCGMKQGSVCYWGSSGDMLMNLKKEKGYLGKRKLLFHGSCMLKTFGSNCWLNASTGTNYLFYHFRGMYMAKKEMTNEYFHAARSINGLFRTPGLG